ncbi:MAG: hypothetical protein AAFY45_29920, partial [Bacteroidota bacterium]
PIQYPVWKLEGYAEYISRSQREELSDFQQNLLTLHQSQENPSEGLPWITFKDGSGVPQAYFEYRILIQFLMEEEGLTYKEILDSEESKEEIEKRIAESRVKDENSITFFSLRIPNK